MHVVSWLMQCHIHMWPYIAIDTYSYGYIWLRIAYTGVHLLNDPLPIAAICYSATRHLVKISLVAIYFFAIFAQ